MRGRVFSCAAGLLAALTLAACASDGGFSTSEELSAGYERTLAAEQSYHYADGAVEPPSAYNNYASLMTDFELKLFRRAFESAQSDSFGFSPVGAALGLTLLENGASNSTAQDVSLALGMSLDAETRSQCASYFKSRLLTVNGIGTGQRDELSGKTAQADPEVYLTLDNVLLIDDATDVRTPFLQKNADYFGADIFRFAFESDGADEKLHTRYGEAFSPDFSAAEENTMLLCSQTAIGDRWLNAYGADDTAQGSFTKADGTQESARFLFSDESGLHTDSAEGVVKYTLKNPLKVVFILPKEDMPLGEYIQRLDAAELDALLTSMDVTKTVRAAIPEVTCETPAACQTLTQPLTACGLGSLFGEKADFGSLAHTDGLRLGAAYDFSPALHLTESGIASGVQTNEKAAQGTSDEAQLCFNRPFLFLILDNESNIPLYIGVKS